MNAGDRSAGCGTNIGQDWDQQQRDAARAGIPDACLAAIDSGAAEEVRRMIAAWPVLVRSATNLIRAVREGQTAIVADLLEAGARVGGGTAELGGFLLLAAAEQGHLAIVRLLVAAGADPNEPVDIIWRSFGLECLISLYAAVERKHDAVAAFLWPLTEPRLRRPASQLWHHHAANGANEAGPPADPAEMDDSGAAGEWTGDEAEQPDPINELMRAIQGDEAGTVADLLRGRGGVLVNTPYMGFQTPLMVAARRGNLPIVKLLIAAGADPDTLTMYPTEENEWSYGRSALHEAMQQGHREVAAYLTPLTVSWVRIHAKVAVIDVPGAADLLLAQATRAGDPAAIHAAIAAGADIRIRTGEDWRTALHLAVLSGDVAIVALLLELGAVVDARDRRGRTALWQAASLGNAAIVAPLLLAGADPDGRAFGDEQTPLMQAVLADDPAMIATLLAAGADPFLVDLDDLSALDLAFYQDRPQARVALIRILKQSDE